jgi:hypothetical protein
LIHEFGGAGSDRAVLRLLFTQVNFEGKILIAFCEGSEEHHV